MRWVPAVLLSSLVVTTLAATGCSSSHLAQSPVTTTPPPTTEAPATSTTVWSPTAAQATPDAAAARLVSAWASGNRGAALAVASPASVEALFAQQYPSGYLQSRGCTSGANPATCTYRNTKTDGIYEIGVTSGSGGWFVSTVTPET